MTFDWVCANDLGLHYKFTFLPLMDGCYLNILFPFDQTIAQEYQVKDDRPWWTNGLPETAQRSWSHRMVWVRMDHTDNLIPPRCQNHRCLYLDQDVPSPISERMEGLLAWTISLDFAWRKGQLGLCLIEVISYSIHPILWTSIQTLQWLPIPGKPEAMLHTLPLHPSLSPEWPHGWKSHRDPEKTKRIWCVTQGKHVSWLFLFLEFLYVEHHRNQKW